MKILISGGHITPALAFIDYVQATHQDEVVFVGRQYSKVKERQESPERAEVEKRGVKFIAFHSGKLSQFQLLELLHQLSQFINSLQTARKIFAQEKPDVFLSFGGYLAVPLAIVASLRGVPIVTHEQTRTAGLANRVIGMFAQKIALSYADSLPYFSTKKTVVTGNPIRPSLFRRRSGLPEWLAEQPHLPILYVTGGSQGSLFINQLVASVLPELTSQWCVIHQCGPSTSQMQYVEMLQEAKERLSPAQQKNYFFREWLNEAELNWLYRWAVIIVSRAGANTVQEIIYAAKPALFIPLPATHQDEQTRNAQPIVQAGAAVLCKQTELTGQTFLSVIHQMKAHYHTLLTHARHLLPAQGLPAEQELYALVQKVVQSKTRSLR